MFGQRRFRACSCWDMKKSKQGLWTFRRLSMVSTRRMKSGRTSLYLSALQSLKSLKTVSGNVEVVFG